MLEGARQAALKKTSFERSPVGPSFSQCVLLSVTTAWVWMISSLLWCLAQQRRRWRVVRRNKIPKSRRTTIRWRAASVGIVLPGVILLGWVWVRWRRVRPKRRTRKKRRRRRRRLPKTRAHSKRRLSSTRRLWWSTMRQAQGAILRVHRYGGKARCRRPVACVPGRFV